MKNRGKKSFKVIGSDLVGRFDRSDCLVLGFWGWLVSSYVIWSNFIATSHDRFPPNGGDCKGNGTPYFREI